MLDIVDENNDFIIINKPQGMGFHNEDEELGFFSQVKTKLSCDLFSVHRLDKVTSGLVIIAKTPKAANEFGKLFLDHKIEKFYLAIAMGKPKKKQGLVKGDIDKARRGTWKLNQTYTNPSLTQFFSFSLIPGKRVYLLKPHTGKTHQLRVVMKSLGAPILGDTLYSAESSDRVYLHAYFLKFNFKGKEYKYKSLPNEGKWFLDEEFQDLMKNNFKKPYNLNWPSI